MTLDELWHNSDIISLNCPLAKETEYIINKDSISKMKDGVMLINTGRGKLIHTKALIDGLKTGKIGTAGLDVYDEEPVRDADHPLVRLPNVICTPHIGYVTRDEYHLQFTDIFAQIVAFADGKPINVVNPNVLGS